MRDARHLVLTTVLVAMLVGGVVYTYTNFQEATREKHVLYQVSTINALSAGLYGGVTTFQELRAHGDTGLGTFEDLDGEMIGIEGEFYQVRFDGSTSVVSDLMKTPFAMVTFFESDRVAFLDKPLDREHLTEYLNVSSPTENIFYAIKISGTFEYVKTRSVPKQSKPYLPLEVAVKNQSTFEFNNVSGIIIGFWTPNYMNGVNMPGYHFHFITQEKNAGGHVLEFRTKSVKIEIDYISSFQMTLPSSQEFYHLKSSGEEGKDLEKIEQQIPDLCVTPR
jgi:acetolactate decarboxylase